MSKVDSRYDIKSEIYFPKKLNDLQGKKFRIPIYQRKYAWRETDIKLLLKDLKEATSNHFIGNIVVEEVDTEVYDVIDGQQRLTTLYLIGLIGKQEGLFELSYEVRENDKAFLYKLKHENKIDERVVEKLDAEFHPDSQLVENIKTIMQEFGEVEYFEKGVFAFTVLKPEEVDIAKYFEVMNSRGKQLEQHQVLKAKFLQCIEKKDHAIYAKLWDYCSRMDVYIEDVIYQYEKQEYDKKSKQSKPVISQQKLRQELLQFAMSTNKMNIQPFFSKANGTEREDFITIHKALDAPDKEELLHEGVNRYRSFIKFEYFLLHVLQLHLAKEETSDVNVELKDSKLIEQYENKLNFLKRVMADEMNDEEKVEIGNIAKSFLHTLFRYRILYDYFFFKRFLSNDEPFIAKLGDAAKGIDIDRYSSKRVIRQILNLQLLFNFSGDFYVQHWTQTVLRWIVNNLETYSLKEFYKKYVYFLEQFDRNIMNLRLNDGDLQKCYLQYGVEAYSEPNSLNCDKLKAYLHNGTGTQHYWFYRLDYILWRDFDWAGANTKSPFATDEKFKYIDIPGKFRLSRLNSVEHIKPQNRKEEWKSADEECEDCPNEGENRVDCFGNLALISQHMNSALSDESEIKKSLIQKQLDRGTIESLKMLIFYSNIKSSTDITLKYCKDHQKEMIEYLCEQNNNGE